MKFDQAEYHKFLFQNNAVGFFPEGKKLKSGRISGWYYNGRRLLDFAAVLDKMAQFVLDYVKEHGIVPDYFISVPDGTTKLADRLNFLLGGKQVQARKVAKTDHGDLRDAYFLGPVEKGDRVVVVEDATTTGGSIFEQIEKCFAAEMNVLASLCEMNRLELTDDMKNSVEDYIQKKFNIRHHSLSNAALILPEAYRILKPTIEVANIIEKEYSDHGATQIKLI